jgi:hypothetical protein
MDRRENNGAYASGTETSQTLWFAAAIEVAIVAAVAVFGAVMIAVPVPIFLLFSASTESPGRLRR